jgi:hypothetical protein
MNGSRADPGVNSRAVHELWRECQQREKDGKQTFQLFVGMVEIYNETILDLLTTNQTGQNKRSSRPLNIYCLAKRIVPCFASPSSHSLTLRLVVHRPN